MNEHNQYSITAHTDKSRNKVIVVCALNIHGYNPTPISCQVRIHILLESHGQAIEISWTIYYDSNVKALSIMAFHITWKN